MELHPMNHPTNGSEAGITPAMEPTKADTPSPSAAQARKAVAAIQDSAVNRGKHALLPGADGTRPTIYPSLTILWNAAQRVAKIREREGI
jgi:hypothetical protein